MTNYGIDDGDGNAITRGVSEQTIDTVAQEIANERKEPVWYFAEGETEEPMTRVDPEECDYCDQPWVVEYDGHTFCRECRDKRVRLENLVKLTYKAIDAEVEKEYVDEDSCAVSVTLLRSDGQEGTIWVGAGVQDCDRGSAKASGAWSSYQTTWAYGDNLYTWMEPRWANEYLELDEIGRMEMRHAILDACERIALGKWKNYEREGK